jgi:hypothetical protein
MLTSPLKKRRGREPEKPFHPSLRFKCVNVGENVWAVRITHSYRALGVWEDDTMTWFWIGSHDEYERHFS